MTRAQSYVVGVAIMFAVTVMALAAILTGLGSVFEAQAANVDASRVADGLDRALKPLRTTGPRSATVSFSDGRLETVDRQLRVRRNGSAALSAETDGLVFTTGDRRVTAVAGAILRGQPGSAWLVRPPPIVVARDIVAVGVVSLNASDQAVSGSGSTILRTNVTHERTALGRGRFTIEVETATPRPLANHFAKRGATVTIVDRDGDGIRSVAASFPNTRTGYLVTHDLRLEVGHG